MGMNNNATSPDRLGHRQRAILAAVACAPGCSILQLDRLTNIGPRHALTYDAVHRLAARGLVRLTTGERGGTYAVFPARPEAP